WEFKHHWLEIVDGAVNGKYQLVSQGAVIHGFSYTGQISGKSVDLSEESYPNEAGVCPWQYGLTMPSSRSRFAARLSSGVGSCDSAGNSSESSGGGFRFGCAHASIGARRYPGSVRPDRSGDCISGRISLQLRHKPVTPFVQYGLTDLVAVG